MLIQHNNLRMYRKRSQLTQTDIAFIMKLSDYANISRWEQGYRQPNIEMLLIYHLLFDIPIESLFERQKHELRDFIGKRIGLLLGELKNLSSDAKAASRIAFLDSALTRLTV